MITSMLSLFLWSVATIVSLTLSLALMCGTFKSSSSFLGFSAEQHLHLQSQSLFKMNGF